MRFITFFIVLLALAGCSKEFSGTYREAIGATRYEFSKEGKVTIKFPAGEVLGTNRVFEFTRSGDSISIKNPDGSVGLTLAITPDESLQGLGGIITLRKVSDD